jgi:arylsulfatase
METCDDEFISVAKDFIKRQHKDGKPFFVWLYAFVYTLYTIPNPQAEDRLVDGSLRIMIR